MGVREGKVEKYLDDQVTKLGGITRKWISPGRIGVPDRIIILRGNVIFVEIKTDDGRLSDQQSREIARLLSHGAKVAVLYGRGGVDFFINGLKEEQEEEAL